MQELKDLERALAEQYRAFSSQQARGQSETYERLTARIADDPELLARIARMPSRNKRQPNLLLAAVRFLGGPYEDYPRFREFVLGRWDEVSATMLARYTQTNEPARCAVLLPLLARLPQPLALLEVGASAGLCLHPDRYRYSYDGGPEIGQAGSPARFECRTSGSVPVPVPDTVPEVVWRAGIDLNPLDVTDPRDRRWLECLIWPGREDRTRGLRAAIEAVRGTPPRLVRGDLVEELPRLAADAPAPEEATLVVFHTAVLTYLPRAAREEFAAIVRGLPGHWISNEHSSVLPWFAGPKPDDPQRLTLALDERPVAFTAPHGQSLEWLPG